MAEIIGIIGGAGVAATNKLLELIEIQLTKNSAIRDVQHPEMVIYQATKAPSRSMYLEGKGESFIDDYIKIGQKLKRSGVTKLCMCCNTAHFAINEMQEKIDLPFINLIEKVVLATKKSEKIRVGLIASDGCLKGHVYEKYFAKLYPEAKIIYPDANYQKLVTKGICNIKNITRFENEFSDSRPKNIFTKVQSHLQDKGAEIIVIGCTDIRVDFKSINTVDSLEILAESIIKEASI